MASTAATDSGKKNRVCTACHMMAGYIQPLKGLVHATIRMEHADCFSALVHKARADVLAAKRSGQTTPLKGVDEGEQALLDCALREYEAREEQRRGGGAEQDE